MKTSKLTLTILSLVLTVGLVAEAKTNAASNTKSKKTTKVVSSKTHANTNTNTKLSTDVKFDGQLVGGQIQTPFESLTVVENEKSIDDLIGVRQNFSDRNEKSKGMR